MSVDVLAGTDLAELHAAIVETSATAFAGIAFEFYRDDRSKLPPMGGSGQPTAVCLLELSELEAAEFDPGTEQQALAARFEAQFCIPFTTPSPKVAIRALAGSYAAFLRKQTRWPDVLNGPIKVTGCYKDDFSPELDQYEVWRVEWTQDIWLGEGTPWLPGPARPEQVLASFVPNVGSSHEPDYVDVTGAP
jgi:hypothetical protein